MIVSTREMLLKAQKENIVNLKKGISLLLSSQEENGDLEEFYLMSPNCAKMKILKGIRITD